MASKHRWMTALTVLLGSMAMGLSATMPVVALPAMIKTFAAEQTTVQWLMSGFQIMATTPVLATGWLGARFGLRRTWVVTLLMFVAASLMGMLATSMPVLIAVRIVQGVAMGLVPAVALIAIARAFPAHLLGLAMGVFGVGAVLAPAVGPYLAGVLLVPFGWQVIFALPLLCCLPALLLALKYIPGAGAQTDGKRFDWFGMVVVTGFIFALLNVNGLGHATGWASWQTLGCLGGAVLMLLAFIRWQLCSKAPLLELALFQSASFRALLKVAVLFGFCLYGASYLIPYFLQSAAGYSPEKSGAMQIPGGMVLIVVIFSAGMVCDRLGARSVILTGLLVFFLSYLGFSFISVEPGFWAVVAWFSLNRVGMGMLIPSTSVAAIQAVPSHLLPYATSTMTFFLGLGGALGINAFSILYQWWLDGGLKAEAAMLATPPAVDAFQRCFWLAMGLLLMALLVTARIRPGSGAVAVEQAHTTFK